MFTSLNYCTICPSKLKTNISVFLDPLGGKESVVAQRIFIKPMQVILSLYKRFGPKEHRFEIDLWNDQGRPMYDKNSWLRINRVMKNLL